MADSVFQTGNAFDATTTTLGHAKKVWRRIEEQLPGGFKIVNAADFATAGLVRSGMAVAYSTAENADAKDIVAIPWADIISAQSPVYTAVESPTGNPKTKGYYEKSGDDYVATTDTSVVADKTYYTKAEAVTTDGLNIIGFLQEDAPVASNSTIATGTVIVKGEIYGYMLGDTVTQAATIAPLIKAMTQKNGLNIRVVD